MLKINKNILNKELLKNVKLDSNILEVLVDISYDEYSEKEQYLEMVQRVIKKYGELVGFALLISTYNLQVCNGGHSHYYFSGYSSDMDTENKNEDVHDILIEYLKKSGLNKSSWYSKLLDILNKFKNYQIDNNETLNHTCCSCGGNGYIEQESGVCGDEIIYDNIECGNCNGSGEETIENERRGEIYDDTWDELDTEYYKINKDVMKDLNEYFTLKIK